MSFTDEMKLKVWEKGTVITNNDPKTWRQDQCGAWIRWSDYGNRQSQYGWEIDHISPGGSDTLSNLRPLQWLNNAEKSDGRLKCNITASGSNNVRKP